MSFWRSSLLCLSCITVIVHTNATNTTIAPSMEPTTLDLCNISSNCAEIVLDSSATHTNQTCPLQQFECGHCLSKLRIVVHEEYIANYNQTQPEQQEQLLDQFASNDHGNDSCECEGGFGEETVAANNIRTLTITTQSNLSTLTFTPNFNPAIHDDIVVSVSSWNYADNDSIAAMFPAEHECHLFFYVNRNSFLNIDAKTVLKIVFEVVDISDASRVLTPQIDSLLTSYFGNVSKAAEETRRLNVSLHKDDRRRRRLQLDDVISKEAPEVRVQVLLFADDAENARQALHDLNASQQLVVGWDDEVIGIIRNASGERTASIRSISYVLLSPQELSTNQEGDDDDEDGERGLLGNVFILVWVSVCLVSCAVMVWGCLCWYCNCCECKREKKGFRCECTCRRKARGGQQADRKSVITSSKFVRHESTKISSADRPATPAWMGNIGTSVRVLSASPGTGTVTGTGTTEIEMQQRGEPPLDLCYSVRPSFLSLDLDAANEDIDAFLPDMISKLCAKGRTTLIEHDALSLDRMLGSGHFGQVFAGTYNGNKVAIKSFPNMDLCDTENGEIASENEHDDGDAAEHVALKQEMNSAEKQKRQKMVSRTKEIYAEAVLASSLSSHPNLVQILGITQNPFKIVMTFYDGGNLLNFVYKNVRSRRYVQKLTLHSVSILLRKILEGLVFLYKNQLVHRDIAARNVLLGDIESDGQISENSKVVIADFGMTRCLMNADEQNEKQTQQKIGPVKWMAPESIRERVYSYKSDVYMFGMLLFEIMHGKEPFSHADFERLSTAVLASQIVMQQKRPVIIFAEEIENILTTNGNTGKRVIEGINELMKKCWAHTPEQRPSLLDILSSLNKLFENV